ncbi:MAG: tyrosine--tRNA ligase [Candidatus Shapirobacteria bacterium]
MTDQIEAVLTRGVEKIYPSKEALERVLRSGKKLRLYQGFDPSANSLHLGNFVGMMKLRQFQKLGHEVIFLVGDFTGMIGDPTDKLAARKALTREQVRENCATWRSQAKKILDFDGPNPVKFLYNSEWLDKISFKDLIELTANFTVQQMLERDMYQKRWQEGKPIHLHEFLYPVAQGYDSVAMDVDLEIGGNDQTFNMLTGRTLMKVLKGKEKFVLTTKLLVDKAGDKVGKTTDNALFLSATAGDFYGGIMAFPDEVLVLSFELLTEVPLQSIEPLKSNPLMAKKRLALEVVKLLYGAKAAQEAQNHFEKVFQNKELPVDLPVFKTTRKDYPLVDLLIDTKMASSRSEAKRLIDQKAVDFDGKILKVGKRRFMKILVRPE